MRAPKEPSKSQGKSHDKSQETPQDLDDELDAALEDSFPASDPPSLTDPSTAGGPARAKPDGARTSPKKPAAGK